MREILEFESEEEFRNWARAHAAEWMRGRDAIETDEVAKHSITHEKAHFEMAKSLGYEPVYGVYADFRARNRKDQLAEQGAVIQYYQVGYGSKKPTPEDLIKICLAPENPSVYDLDIVERCRKDLREGDFCKAT